MIPPVAKRWHNIPGYRAAVHHKLPPLAISGNSDEVARSAEAAVNPETVPILRDAGSDSQSFPGRTDSQQPLGNHPEQPGSGSGVPRPASPPEVRRVRTVNVAGRDIWLGTV